MLDGLYKLTFDSSKTITSYDEIETDADFPAVGDEGEVYYFGTSPKEGAMTTGKTTIDIDGEKYTYNFRKSASNKGLCKSDTRCRKDIRKRKMRENTGEKIREKEGTQIRST